MGSQRLKAEGEGNSRTSSSSWWWTGKPSELQFMGSQSWTQLRDWTELKELDTAERLTLHFKQCTDPYVMCFHRMKHNLGFLGSDDSWCSKCKINLCPCSPKLIAVVTVEREKGLAQSTKNILAPSNLYNFQHRECGGSHKCVQFSSVTQSCLTLWAPMNCSTPGLPVHHQLPEFTQTHNHRVSDAIQPPHPLLSPSPLAPNPSQHQSLFQWVNTSHEVAKVLEFQLQHQSFQWTTRTDLL